MDMLTDKIASAHLGKKSKGSEFYDASLLVAVPRFENRKQYGIENENLPFEGFDVWHAFEFSVLTQNGLPVTRILKLRYKCDNDYIIESKSLKLYLNSFNMSKIGSDIKDCLETCKNIITRDLSEKLHADVEVNFIENNSKRVEIFGDFKNILEKVDEKSLKFSKYKEAPEVLEAEHKSEHQEYYLMFDSLRSNCRVTHQPDFGDVFIYYKSDKHIVEESLVEYLVSFRSEFHFHEECCEMIYKRLYDILGEDAELFVCALYTRRGGIDICPSRWSKNCRVNDVEKLIDLSIYARCGLKGG